uniref:Uncharacterized protein n=1 Tax=Anopheles maculatus TaxID=74869 RepID=A0A182SFM5_9DIPT
MKRNAAENLEILNLNRQVEDLAKELQRQVDEQKRSMEHEMRKQGDLEAQIRKEKDKNVSLFEECERLKKNIEKLKENMSEVERELLAKLKTLQQDNDTLSVMLEGLRTENELLAEERTQLEHSLKSLEASPIKEVRPVSPKRPSMNVSVQTDQAVEKDAQDSTQNASKVFLQEPPSLVERRVQERETLPMDMGPRSRRSSVVARMSRERHAYETSEAVQLLSRQVSVSHMIPKLSHI